MVPIVNFSEFQDRLTREIPRLSRRARSIVADEQDAEDLVQDTLEHALQFGPPRETDDLGDWLETILSHCGNSRRDKSAAFDNSIESIHVAECNAAIDVHDLLEDLPSTHRVIIGLVIQGVKYRDIAVRENIPIGTVMSRLGRVRARLRTAFVERKTASAKPPFKALPLEIKPAARASAAGLPRKPSRPPVRKARVAAPPSRSTHRALPNDVPDWFKKLTGEIA